MTCLPMTSLPSVNRHSSFSNLRRELLSFPSVSSSLSSLLFPVNKIQPGLLILDNNALGVKTSAVASILELFSSDRVSFDPPLDSSFSYYLMSYFCAVKGFFPTCTSLTFQFNLMGRLPVSGVDPF